MTYSSFEECWDVICRRLFPKPQLYCWSAAGRAKGFFEVTLVEHEGITVRTGKGLRFVPRRDFEVLFPLWPDYKNGKIQRYKLKFNFHTTYVLSIFHWLELQPIS